MNRTNIEAAGIISNEYRMKNINASRTTWTLTEWSAYFKSKDSTYIMSPSEIAAACIWLTEKGYPVPTDCPKKPEPEWSYQGGCPAFKPVLCLTYGICQMARGMCNEVSNVSICPTCGKMIDESDFRDSLSLKEHRISGMCQKCQDRVFTPKEDPCENCDKVHTGCKYKDDCPV